MDISQNYNLTVFGVVCSVALFILAAIYQVVASPLSRLPGPSSSKWTNLPLKIAVLRGERKDYVHELHERYGPIVRISPWEVSLADVSAVRTIYKTGSPYIKSPWYRTFVGDLKNYGLFAEPDRKKHADLRRIVAANFTEKWIKNLEPYIAKNVQLAVMRLADEANRQGYCDLFKWFTFMATDVIGEASFGESFRTLETGKKTQYYHDLEQVGRRGLFRAEFFNVTRLLSHLPIKPIKDVHAAVQRMLHYADQSVERYWLQYRADPVNVKPTLLTKEYAVVEAGLLTPQQLRRDAAGYIVAGTDTTAITATYAVWFLAQLPDIEQELIREVAAVPSDFDDEVLRTLPVLNGVINETLRLRSAVGQCLPRVVPPTGAEFGGYFIPGGAIVGIQAWTMHRDPKVWEDPEAFKPSRWENPTREMKDSFVPFGGGSRVCIGMHFAQLELRHALTNFYRTFEGGVKPSAAEGFSEADMKPMTYFLEPPKGRRCLVMRRK